MSTILKALRRLEHDRSARSGRPLRQEVMSEPKSRPRARRWPLLVAAVVFGIAAGPMALVMWTELLPKTGVPESSSVSTANASDEAQAAEPILPSEPLETLPAPEPLAALPADEPATPEFVAEAPPPPVISSEVEVLRRPARAPRIAAHIDDVPPAPTGPPLGSVRPHPSSDWMPVAGHPPVSTIAGCFMVGNGLWPVSMISVAPSWEPSLCVMERMTVNLSACFAVSGRCSQTCRPATLVGIDLKMLRYFAPSSGFRSNVSMWLIPPPNSR